MKQNLYLSQNLKLELKLSQNMQNSLNILKMNQSELQEYISNLIQRNPVISYTSTSNELQSYLIETVSQPVSLKDDLYLQLHTSPFHYDENICNFIIESLDCHGFLTYSENEMAKYLSCDIKQIRDNMKILQSFEPIGVCTKNSIDSIILQLQKKRYYKAIEILENYKFEIKHHMYSEIASEMNLELQDVLNLLQQIQSCNPFPCSSYTNDITSFILPDFELIVTDDSIDIIPKNYSQVSIESELLSNCKKELKEYFNEAHFFIDALHKRNKTLLILLSELINIQKNHFLFHDELQPCTLHMISEKTGFHESTISRTLSNKYYLFQNEIYPVKNLFVSSTKEGSSKDSIEKAILKIIKDEDKLNPYSDQQLVLLLEDLDLYVSRRTITKYRKLLHIPNSKDRKQR